MNATLKTIITILNISVLTFLLVATSSPCFAMLAIEDVSTNRAKELGVTIRTNMNGQAGIQVQLEFKTDGELKKITCVELQIGDGENRIMSLLPHCYIFNKSVICLTRLEQLTSDNFR